MTTNYTDMAKRYEMADKLVFSKLLPWQQQAITSDRLNNKRSSLFDTFVSNVIKTAESMIQTPMGTKPSKKKSKAKPLDMKARLG